MKTKTIYFTLALILISTWGFSQIESNPLLSTPYIEVTGEGEIEVVPDEIFLQFTLKERYDGKEKINLEDLEKKLKKQLKAKGFDLSKLTLADADADYVTIKRKKKDVLASKDYVMEVGSTTELADIWDILGDLDVSNASILRVDHSKMDEFKKEVKIEAIKNAQAKASYLLNAIGQKVSKALFVQERENFPQPYLQRMKLESSILPASNTQEIIEPEISFKKIKLNYKVFVRFAIE